MIRAAVFPYRLPLVRPWLAASATLTERRGTLLRLIDDDGMEGWGDCAPLPSGGDADAVLAALADWARRPVSADFSRLPPEARWAIETAQADRAARRRGVPLARYFNPAAPLVVAVNAALGALGNDDCIARATAAHAQGYVIGKLKVGVGAVDEELARLRDLHAAAPGLRLRLDANRAWGEADAQRFLAAVADLPIDAVEEPLAQPTAASLAALQRELPFAIAVDESLPQLGADALFAAGAMRRLVLKPARLGGIAATRALVARAHGAGVAAVLTSVVDSAVGVTAAAHLAAAVSPHIAHGLATLDWLAADVAAGPPLRDGTLWLADAPGLGLTLDDAFA